MKQLKKISNQSIIDLAENLKNSSLEKEIARKLLIEIGKALGNEIKNSYYKRGKSKKGFDVFNNPLSVVVTTKNDALTFGFGLTSSLDPAIAGYMDFEGRRGSAALNTPVRDINLPSIGNKPVDYLIVAKCVLATGCTAISLSKTAISEYNPKLIIIATIFYSKIGLIELQAAFPNASFIFVGEPYPLREDGMLDPVIYLPDEILN